MEDYILVGAVEFLGTETCKIMGYQADVPSKYPVLCYSKHGKLDEGLLYTEIDGKFKYIPSHYILNRYSLFDAKEDYPELFL